MSVHRLKTTNQAVKWKVKTKPYGGKRQALTQDELDRLFTASSAIGMVTATT